MLQEHRKKITIGIGIGFPLQIAAKVISHNLPSFNWLAAVMEIASVPLIVLGCVYYAKAKGYSGYWGALGIFWLIGFVILALFHDKHKNAT